LKQNKKTILHVKGPWNKAYTKYPNLDKFGETKYHILFEKAKLH